MSEPDYSLFPSREMQLDWLHTYLKAYKHFTKKGEEVNQCELETLYVQVNKFSLVSGRTEDEKNYRPHFLFFYLIISQMSYYKLFI